METVAILGSGFGLYGYLPAIATTSQVRFAMPQRYQLKYTSRPELAQWQERIEWCSSEADALERSSSVVLALCPERQAHWLEACLALKNIRNLLLEKPLARCPLEGMQLQHQLNRSGKNYRIGYLFRYLPWMKALADALRNGLVTEPLVIDWQFHAHHFRHAVPTWKRDHAVGGGALRFYGIHLVALLAELGYSQTLNSQLIANDSQEVSAWQATLCGSGRPTCHLVVDSTADETRFVVRTASGRVLLAAEHPFAAPQATTELATTQTTTIPAATTQAATVSEPAIKASSGAIGGPGTVDMRVSVLASLWKDLQDTAMPPQTLYAEVLDLWQDVERVAETTRRRQAA